MTPELAIWSDFRREWGWGNGSSRVWAPVWKVWLYGKKGITEVPSRNLVWRFVFQNKGDLKLASVIRLSIWQDIYSSTHPNFVYFLYRKIAFVFYLMKSFSSPNGHLKTLFMISSSLLVSIWCPSPESYGSRSWLLGEVDKDMTDVIKSNSIISKPHGCHKVTHFHNE